MPMAQFEEDRVLRRAINRAQHIPGPVEGPDLEGENLDLWHARLGGQVAGSRGQLYGQISRSTYATNSLSDGFCPARFVELPKMNRRRAQISR